MVELERLLRAFEEIVPRRTTQTTVVYERAQIDAWRQKCGEAMHERVRSDHLREALK